MRRVGRTVGKMSLARLFAGAAGAVYVIVGLLALLATGVAPEARQFVIVGTSLADVLLDFLLGGSGLAACAAGPGSSTLYAQVVGVVLAVVALALSLPQAFLGLPPVSGANVLLYALTAAVALYVGFARPDLRTPLA